jgi:hypothetical protein
VAPAFAEFRSPSSDQQTPAHIILSPRCGHIPGLPLTPHVLHAARTSHSLTSPMRKTRDHGHVRREVIHDQLTS